MYQSIGTTLKDPEMSYQRLVSDCGHKDEVNPKVDKSTQHKYDVKSRVEDTHQRTQHKHDVKPKVDPSTQIRHLIFLESLQARSSKPTCKMQSKLARAAAAIHGGPGSSSSKHSKSKVSKLLRLPTSQVKRLRDAYVSFMMSLAGNNNFKMSGNGIIYGSCSWPCSVEAGKYPGRKPRIEKAEEEIAYAHDLYVQTAGNGPRGIQVARSPACGRKAIYPL